MSKLNTQFNTLSQKVVVFTGALKSVTRRQAAAIAFELGAEVKKSVTKDTDLVVAGAKAGKKLQDAAAQSKRIISESDFFAIVRQQRAAAKAAKLNG